LLIRIVGASAASDVPNLQKTRFPGSLQGEQRYHHILLVLYNLQMDKDETLQEFVQVLGRIKDLLGESMLSVDNDIDLVAAVEHLRQSGNNKDADELAELCKRADELKAQHRAIS